MASQKTQKEKYLQDLPVADKVKKNLKLSKKDVLTEEGLLLVESLVIDGANMTDVAKTLGVHPKTLWEWRKAFPELEAACAKGKEIVDYKVENALLKAALGYTTTTVKTYINDSPGKDGNRTVKIEKTESETGPNVTACLAWLNNRRPDKWRRNRDNIAEHEEKKSGVTINIVRGKEQIEVEGDQENWND